MDSLMKKHHRAEKGCYVYNLVLCFLTGFACSVFCWGAYWFCCLTLSRYCAVLIVYAPYIWSSVVSPKCLFIVANAIVAFLIGESNLMDSSGNTPSSSQAADDIHDEYVRRSRELRVSREAAEIEREEITKPCQMEVTEFEQSVERVDEDELVKQDVIEEKGKEEEDEAEEEEDAESLPAEELNKRVEDFIARVNRQRCAEARALVCWRA